MRAYAEVGELAARQRRCAASRAAWLRELRRAPILSLMEKPMAYLDVMPMTVALRTTPEAFRLERGYLRHMPSAHDFVFDGARHVAIRAQCGCAYLSIKPEQEPELISAYEQWRNEYWRPMQVNQEFASHFRARSPWRQALVRFTRWLHELSLRPERTPQREPAAVPTPGFVG